MKAMIVLLLAISYGLVGCVSISTLQDAETTKKGEMSHTVAIGNIGGEVDVDGASGLPGDLADEISVPMIDYMFRYGFHESMDFGLRISGSSYGADWKWNFINGEFGLASGLGIGISEYEIESGSTKEKYSLQDLVIPVYTHYNFNETLRGYLVPKFVIRSVNTNATGVENTSNNLLGATIGLKINKWFVEYTTLTGESEESEEDISVSQFAAGYTF
tara:strand:+ start:101779 stop:102429 length:651 start_codon:yes stop_codon:yes gene_type:complete